MAARHLRPGPAGAEPISSVQDIGRVLYRDYAYAFGVTAFLILVAMVGAIFLARRDDRRI